MVHPIWCVYTFFVFKKNFSTIMSKKIHFSYNVIPKLFFGETFFIDSCFET
jgi:hypothetical protein